MLSCDIRSRNLTFKACDIWLVMVWPSLWFKCKIIYFPCLLMFIMSTRCFYAIAITLDQVWTNLISMTTNGKVDKYLVLNIHSIILRKICLNCVKGYVYKHNKRTFKSVQRTTSCKTSRHFARRRLLVGNCRCLEQSNGNVSCRNGRISLVNVVNVTDLKFVNI